MAQKAVDFGHERYDEDEKKLKILHILRIRTHTHTIIN
jgi:riboflavin synthase